MENLNNMDNRAEIARIISHDNELRWCFQSQVYGHAFLAAKMHLSEADWNAFLDLSQQGKLVRAPLFRGTLHTLPLDLYLRIADVIRPVVERVVKSNQSKRYGVETIDDVWARAQTLVAHAGTIPVDSAVNELSSQFPTIRKTDLKYLIRSAPGMVEIADGEQRIKNVPIKTGALDQQTLFAWYVQSFKGTKNDFRHWSGFLNREINESLTEGFDNAPHSNTPLSQSSENTVLVLPPFDPYLLAYAKEHRLRHIDADHYNDIWGRSGLVNGAIVKNGIIIGRLTVKGGKLCRIDTWHRLEQQEINALERAINFMLCDLQEKATLEIHYCDSVAE